MSQLYKTPLSQFQVRPKKAKKVSHKLTKLCHNFVTTRDFRFVTILSPAAPSEVRKKESGR